VSIVAATLRAPLRPVPVAAVVGGAVGLVALGAVAAARSGTASPLLAAMALVTLGAIAYLAAWSTATTFVAFGMAATVFSGNSKLIGFPIAPDRLLLAAGIGALVLGLPNVERPRRIIWRPVHFLLAATAAYATASALAAHTLSTSDGLFALLDRLGVVPFLAFTLAPIVFGNRKQRDLLLAVFVGCGLYLGLTALFEAIGLNALVFPHYIIDPSVGIHIERARGPFAEAVANGMGLYGCAVASAVAWTTWTTRPRGRVLAAVVCILCLLGTVFTLTRAVWLATVIATGLAMLLTHRTRRFLVPAIAVGVVAVLGALLLVPSFATQFDERRGDERSVWDRYNTNRAGMAAVKDEPLFGLGWQTWREKGQPYFQLSPDYPLTGTIIEIHNVPLSLAAELGLVGLGLWAMSFLFGIGGGILRPGPTELDPWRLGLVALAVHWLVVASFGPLSYAFPTLLLWAWAGVCSVGHLSTPVQEQALVVARR
jgi:putative inorganic carbon (HCO3(-)) transporter